MPLPPFRNGRHVNPEAAFLNCLLISALTHKDYAAAEQCAANFGAQILFWNDDDSQTTFRPRCVIVRDENAVLVVFAGTCNFPQWAYHVGGAIVPSVDYVIARFVGGSYLVGEELAQGDVFGRIDRFETVRFAGHSFGGAVATLMALHLATSPRRPATIEVQTFGEPRAIAGAQPAVMPEVYDRIVHPYDLVPRTPSKALMYCGYGLIASATKIALAQGWRHFGNLHRITDGEIHPWTDPLSESLAGDLLNLGGITNVVQNHGIDECYLRLTARNGSMTSAVEPLFPLVSQLTGQSYTPPDTIGPPVTVAALNAGWFGGDGPITEENRPYWSAVSAQGIYLSPSGDRDMRMRGTMLFNLDNGGFSETLYAVENAGISYNEMTNAMQQLVPLRAKLSEGTEKMGAWVSNSALRVFGLRIDDVDRRRDSQPIIINEIFPGFSANQPQTNSAWTGENFPANVVMQYKIRGANPGQTALVFLHGVPISAIDSDSVGQTFQKWTGSQSYPPDLFSGYERAYKEYFDKIRSLGLGYRYLNSPWDIDGNPGPMAQPAAVEYDAARRRYRITMPQAAPQFRMRYVLRGFKALDFLNGRRAGRVVAGSPNTIEIDAIAPDFVWDGEGYVSPEVWGYFTPLPSVRPMAGQLPGATFIKMGTKKIGRPFGVHHGRSSRPKKKTVQSTPAAE